MRPVVSFFASTLLLSQAAWGDVSQSFDGTGAGDTPVFKIGDRWEVQWTNAANVTVQWEDGTTMIGTASIGPGSLYLARGGSYKLHIKPQGSAPWHVSIFTVGAPGTTAVPHGIASYTPSDMTSNDDASTTTASSTNNATSPYSPAPPFTAAPAAKLTDAQTKALVLIKGDNSEGTGFLVKTATGPVVVTNQHVLANNPHLQVTTSTGETIKLLGLQGASDRDLAMISIQDNKYTYFDTATDDGATVQNGDEVLTPGNSQGGEVLLSTTGKVLALGPQRIEISNPIYHGNSGGPIIHVKSGKVIGVVTEAMKVDTTNALDKASFSNRNSAINGEMRYFGMRFDSVPRWDAYTWPRFENETTFLTQFHERSKCLDSYLNTPQSGTTEWDLYYLKDEKVKAANEQIRDMSNGADSSQRLEAWRNLIFNLTSVAETDLKDIQVPANFYAFDQIQARDEAAYRQSLQKEIDGMSNDVSRIGGMARRND